MSDPWAEVEVSQSSGLSEPAPGTEPRNRASRRTLGHLPFQVESTAFIWDHFYNKGKLDRKEERQPLWVKGSGKAWGASSGITRSFANGKETAG